jgi:hypothetical protein
MTKSPVPIEHIRHQAPGIDDHHSDLYREFDKCGRTNSAFMQRAALAGIKNLNTASFKNESPLTILQSRFPEKYSNQSSFVKTTGSKEYS